MFLPLAQDLIDQVVFAVSPLKESVFGAGLLGQALGVVDHDLRLFLSEGHEVELVSTEEGVLLRSRKKVRYRLADLVPGITPQNTHSETDWGAEVGREIVE